MNAATPPRMPPARALDLVGLALTAAARRSDALRRAAGATGAWESLHALSKDLRSARHFIRLHRRSGDLAEQGGGFDSREAAAVIESVGDGRVEGRAAWRRGVRRLRDFLELRLHHFAMQAADQVDDEAIAAYLRVIGTGALESAKALRRLP